MYMRVYMGKQVTPLRYPGGKAKLYPQFSIFIKENYKDPPTYCEPFAGGFGLGISLLMHDDVSDVIINDYDFCIYAFWCCVRQEELFQLLMDRIDSTEITVAEWYRQKNIYKHYESYTIPEVGFATFFLNRCNRSGILDANPIGGIKQEGKYKIDCRFNKENLKKTICDIHEKRGHIQVFHQEAKEFLPEIDRQEDNLLINLDPPYYSAGPMLYKNNFSHEDHAALAHTVQKLHNKWVMTYDDQPEIRELYKENLIRQYQLNYYLAEKRKATELIIYDNRFLFPLDLA